MDNNERGHFNSRKEDSHKILAGYLVSALDMEDEVARGVYNDYLQRKNWPHSLSNKFFEEISEKLRTLIAETKQHRQIFADLLDKLKKNHA